MKQLASRAFTQLSVEWKTEDDSSQEVPIRHCGTGAGWGKQEMAGRQARSVQPLTLPAPLPNERWECTLRKGRGRWGFIGNGLRFTILFLGLCVPTFSRAALVAAWRDNTVDPTWLRVGIDNIRALATVSGQSDFGATGLCKGSLPLRDRGALPTPRRIGSASKRMLTEERPDG